MGFWVTITPPGLLILDQDWFYACPGGFYIVLARLKFAFVGCWRQNGQYNDRLKLLGFWVPIPPQDYTHIYPGLSCTAQLCLVQAGAPCELIVPTSDLLCVAVGAKTIFADRGVFDLGFYSFIYSSQAEQLPVAGCCRSVFAVRSCRLGLLSNLPQFQCRYRRLAFFPVHCAFPREKSLISAGYGFKICSLLPFFDRSSFKVYFTRRSTFLLYPTSRLLPVIM